MFMHELFLPAFIPENRAENAGNPKTRRISPAGFVASLPFCRGSARSERLGGKAPIGMRPQAHPQVQDSVLLGDGDFLAEIHVLNRVQSLSVAIGRWKALRRR
jgi:hypothetical protein